MKNKKKQYCTSYTGDKKIVEDLCAIESGLTPWQVDFAESLYEWVNERLRTLSDKQRAAALKILEEHG